MADRKEILEVAGHEVAISNPGKVFFPRTGHSKLDLVRYYLSVADGAMAGIAGRPMVLKRFVNGAEREAFFQKRAPESRPPWIDTVELRFPSGRSAVEVVPRDAATLIWAVNLGCIDLNPHPVRADDLDHPDELRVDLDPVPGVEWPQIVQVALVAQGVLADFGLTGWPKTSGLARVPRLRPDRAPLGLRPGPPGRGGPGSRGGAPPPRQGHIKVVEGRAARRVHRLQPERPDRTVASAYSVRGQARRQSLVSIDLGGSADVFGGLDIETVPQRFATWATRGGAWTRRLAPWSRCSPWPTRTRRPGCRTPRGRRTTTSRRARRRGSSRPSAGPPGARQAAGRRTSAGREDQGPADRPPPVHHAAHRGGPRRQQGRGPGRAGPLEGAARRGVALPGAG